MNVILKITCASLVFAGISATSLRADEIDRAFAEGVNAANAKLRGGDVDAALEQYADVSKLAPESADLSYNMAVAQYRKGDMAAAQQLFQSAAMSENDSLAGKARYNLGNCNYAAGLKLAQSDREGAIKQLESAIENYRSSLEVDSANGDARANIELASQLIDKLREEQKQQEQQQNDQNQQQNQQQDQQQQSSDEQQNSQQQNSQDQKDQQQNEQQNKDQQSQDQQSSDQHKQDQQNQDQQQDQNKDQQQQDSKSQSAQNDQQQEQKDQQAKDEQQHEQQKQDQSKQEQQEQDQRQQDSAQQNEQQSAPKEQQQDAKSQQQQQPQNRPQQPQQESTTPEETKEQQGKQPPQGELTSATEEEAKDSQEKRVFAAFDPAKDGEMTQEEAEKMLQAIRDREMLRRYDQRREEMQHYIPVDRDW